MCSNLDMNKSVELNDIESNFALLNIHFFKSQLSKIVSANIEFQNEILSVQIF